MIRVYLCKIDKDLAVAGLGRNKLEAFKAIQQAVNAQGWPVSMVKMKNVKRKVSK